MEASPRAQRDAREANARTPAAPNAACESRKPTPNSGVSAPNALNMKNAAANCGRYSPFTKDNSIWPRLASNMPIRNSAPSGNASNSKSRYSCGMLPEAYAGVRATTDMASKNSPEQYSATIETVLTRPNGNRLDGPPEARPEESHTSQRAYAHEGREIKSRYAHPTEANAARRPGIVEEGASEHGKTSKNASAIEPDTMPSASPNRSSDISLINIENAGTNKADCSTTKQASTIPSIPRHRTKANTT